MQSYVKFVILLTTLSYHNLKVISMKNGRFFCICLSLALLASIGAPGARAYTYDGMPEVDIRAAAALLVDADTGEYLYAKNINARREPASVTKIMTCLLALEMIGDWEARKNETVTVTEGAFFDMIPEGSIAGLQTGEQLRLEDMLYCMMLQSGNDASNVLAIHLSGSVAAFVERMNSRAQELGCQGTQFANPHGLPNSNHYTTAADIYKITEQAVRTPLFMDITHRTSWIVPATNKSAERVLTTTNSLISTARYSEYYYPPARGIKTGWTTNAGLCLVSSAERDNLRLISVILGAERETNPDRQRHFVETRLLLEWGFENFTQKRLLSKTPPISQIKVLRGVDKDVVTLVPEREIFALVPKTLDISLIERKVSLKNPEGMYAPIFMDEVLGTVTLEYEGHVYGTVDLIAAYTVQENTVEAVRDLVAEWLSQTWIRWTLAGLLTLLLLYIVLTLALNARRKREKNRRPGNYRGRRR